MSILHGFLHSVADLPPGVQLRGKLEPSSRPTVFSLALRSILLLVSWPDAYWIIFCSIVNIQSTEVYDASLVVIFYVVVPFGAFFFGVKSAGVGIATDDSSTSG
jgi:hypothetical protein